MKHVITGKYAGKRLSKYTIEYLAVSYLYIQVCDESGHSGVSEIRLEEKLKYREED